MWLSCFRSWDIWWFCLFSAPKSEDTYEITIPFEENNFEQQGFFNQSDQNFDGKCHTVYKVIAVTVIILWCSTCEHWSCSCHPQNQPRVQAHLQSATHTWWSTTCGPSSRSLWRKTRGCRKESRIWRRSGTSCGASWTASSFPRRARDRNRVRVSTVTVRKDSCRLETLSIIRLTLKHCWSGF